MNTWDAVETAEKLRTREVSRREVVDAAIARAEARGSLGAIVTETFARARSRCDGATGPLAGVPTFIKDLVHVEGVGIGWGTRAVRGVVSTRSDPAVRVIESLGLVCLGKSATPELGMTATTEPLERAPCRNPWDQTRSSGGSSGGAAALVASGVVPIAHASDGGGSIRIPASSTGLVGLKPTRGRLDMEGSQLLPVNVAVHGVLTRTVRDTIAFWSAIDASTRPARPIGAVPSAPRTRLRIAAYVDSPLGRPVAPDVHRAVHDAARACEALGHHVELVPCPFPARVVEDFVRYWALLAWLQHRLGRVLVHSSFDSDRLEPWTRGLSRWCEREPRPMAAATRRLRHLTREHAEVMARYDVLLSPVIAHPPPLLGHFATDAPFELALERILDHCPFTGIANAAGNPALSLPLGRTVAGVPIGVQLAGRAHEESTLLALALELERAHPWPTIAPGWT